MKIILVVLSLNHFLLMELLVLHMPSLLYFNTFKIELIFLYKRISEVLAPTMVDSMVANGYIEDIFSMCLTEQGGIITLGAAGNHHS